MKRLMICLLVFPAALPAQNFGGMSQEDMQKMMAQAQEMQACMAKIDQQELQKIQARAEKMMAEVEALCKSGEKEKARATAVANGKELIKEPVMQEMQGCAKLMQQQVPAMVWAELGEPGRKETDVCEMNRGPGAQP